MIITEIEQQIFRQTPIREDKINQSIAYPLARSSAIWTTTLKASFLLLFFIRKFFSAPPGRYSTTTQQMLLGIPRCPVSVCTFKSLAPIIAPINCKIQVQDIVR
jgi:hypothetical protein